MGYYDDETYDEYNGTYVQDVSTLDELNIGDPGTFCSMSPSTSF